MVECLYAETAELIFCPYSYLLVSTLLLCDTNGQPCLVPNVAASLYQHQGQASLSLATLNGIE